MDTLVTLQSVRKSFGPGALALDCISGAIRSNAITGVVGPDGAGKTTLLRLLTGLMLPDEGEVEVEGLNTRQHALRIQGSIGYMPQRFGLYEDLTVEENLALYGELRAVPRNNYASTVRELLAFTDLAPFRKRLAGKLSGGMKQKLGLACALLQKPRLLLLDEPSVGVDPVSRRELWRVVQRLKAQGVGVVWSTAYLDEAETCDRVFLLDRGRLLFDGVPGDLTERVANRVFRVTGLRGRRRTVLSEVMASEDTVDAVIQGTSVRVVVRTPSEPAAPASAGAAARVNVTKPRFEDAFVDILANSTEVDRKARAYSRLAAARTPLPRRAEPVIEAHGLTKCFGDFAAARDISFEIARGEIFGLLGPNGAGKSTTFRMLCGLLKPTHGEGRVAGFDLRRDAPAARGRLGYMAQKFSLYGDLSVAQNLEFFAGAYGLSGERRSRQIGLINEVFELTPRLALAARELPLGFKQRLALGCAVIHEPEVLFLDEPTSGVDPLTRREFWSHINGLVEKGVAVLVTTHFMEEAEYCDRIALIYRGRSIALGTPDALKAQARSAEHPDPTLEDAFVALVKASEVDAKAPTSGVTL